MTSIIDSLYEELRALSGLLESQKETSLLISANNHFRKVLLLSAASHFEHQIQEMVINFVSIKTRGDDRIVAFLKQKGVERQYHTYFDWDGSNANKFFSLFGPTFSDKMKKEVKKDPKLEEGIKSFLEIGRLRNQSAHINFATYPLEKTAEEIYSLYKAAEFFISRMTQELQ